MDLIIWGALSLHLFGRVFLSSEEVRGVSVVRDEANNPLQIPVTAPDTGIPPCEALPLEEGTAEKGCLHTDHSPGLGEEGSPLWVGMTHATFTSFLGFCSPGGVIQSLCSKQAFFSKSPLPHIYFSCGRIKLRKHQNVRGQELIAVQLAIQVL